MPTPGLFSGLSLLLAIFYLALLLFTFVPIERRNRWLLVFLALSSVWQIALYLAPNFAPVDIPSKILLLCTAALGSATAVYNNRQPTRAWLLGSTALMLGTIFTDLFFMQYQPVKSVDIAGIIRIGAWLTLSVAILIFSRQQYLQIRSPRQANRLLFWAVTILVVFFAEIGTLTGNGLLSLAGQFLRMVGSVALVYAVTHRNLLDVRTRLWRILAVLIKTTITALPTIIVVVLSPLYLDRIPTTAVLLIVLLNLLFFVPLFRLISRLVNRFLFGKRVNFGDIVRQYSKQVANTLEINELTNVTINTVNTHLNVDRGILMLCIANESAITIEPILTKDINHHTMYQFNSDNSFIQALHQHVPVLRDEIEHDMYESLSQAELNWFKLIDMEVYAPISAGDEITGVLAIGPKRSGAIFQQRELNLLQRLAEQTAVALQNARLFRRLETQNESNRQLNENLQRQNVRLETLDKVKTDFISIASHELRTPLTQVKGYADLLAGLSRDGVLTSQQTYEIMTHIDRATNQLERVIAAMLDASQLDVEDVQLNLTKVAVAVLVQTAVAPYRTGLRERRIAFTINDITHLPLLELDYKRMVQAFTNVIGNAIKFTPDRGRIDVTGKVLEDIAGETFVELVIKDTGIGIDAQYHELIFEKFFRIGATQLHSSGNTKFKGAGPGLGLHIAKAVITAHKGRIWIESPGEDEAQLPGSEFHIILPVRQNKELS